MAEQLGLEQVLGIAEQLMGTKGMSRRELLWWMTRAKSSLPVPVSPRSSTLLRVSVTFFTSARMLRSAALSPMIVLKSCSLAISRFRSWFSTCRLFCRSAFRTTCLISSWMIGFMM